ncbi:hypothetical protein EDEG_01381 [Edhazardia aedis USNM 41457]|uniref:40S ribosomal protein S24 n=1 Tax=Edhazardia aedis (strain USNM 41457) TaxID=1003232 RepID=J9DSS9_EDHAE|nr:hypothetical protein EDEG_01381 [Edhazardia aedis USNM 41457]|eukprot:EJW04377.1 hypothetical protein EDEG_01381 [Edhazardia aedis USNM 41457]
MAFKLEIVKQTENKLLQRKELDLILTHTLEKTPNKIDVSKRLATTFQADPKNVIVYDCKGRFGSHVTHSKAKIYFSFDQLKTVERDFVVARISPEDKVKKPVRKARKDARKKALKVFGSLKRRTKKAERKKF